MAHNPYEQYRKTQVQTANQGQLIMMMYDGAIRFLNQSIEGLQNKKYDIVNNNIIKTQDIITELMLALKLDVGEIAKNLYSLYEYMNRRLVEANIKKDEEIIIEVRGFLNELRDTWQQVIQKLNKAEDAASSQKSESLNISG